MSLLHPPARFFRVFFRPVFAACLAVFGVVFLTACSREGALDDIHGIDLSQAQMGRSFTLVDAQGQPRSLDDFKGKVLVLFFGFVQCPDICPATLVRAVQAKKLLGEEAPRVQVAFVTVDPERDTPDILGTYTRAFDPDFIGLTGTPEQIAATAKEFKVFYQKVPTASSYTLDHTALSYVFDTKGRLQLALRHEQSAGEVAQDVRKVLALH